MKIKKIIVVDENDVTHEWEGVSGAVSVRSTNYAGIKAQPYQQQVVATLTLAPQEGIKA